MSHPNQYVTLSIASLGEATLPKPEPKPFFEKKINDISDISGAQPGPKYQHFYNKPQFLQSDVHGSTSKALSWGRNVRDNSLYIDDIDGTRHSIKDRMMRTGRHVDPLEPSYPLPSYVPAEYPATKFIKDPLDHSDIDGSYTKQKKYFSTRDTMKVDDIEGSRPKPLRPRIDPGSLANGEHSSAPTHRFKDRTSRVTDPNNPSYHINGMDYYDDKYTKPKTQKGYIADNHLLQTKDITGATPGFKDTKFERREIRNINYIQDIEGAQADSIKHSIVTKRESNPLAPVYQSLDPGELLQPLIPPLIPPSMVKVPTIPVQRGNKVPAPASEPKPASSGFGGPQYDDNDYDPVSFASSMEPVSVKPPSGREFKLDFSASGNNNAGGGNGFSSSGGFGGATWGGSARNNQASPYNSGRLSGGGPTRMGAAAANSFSGAATSSGYYGNITEAAAAPGKTLSFQSPSPSARGGGNSGRLTPMERRSALERSAEINAVRDLRQ